MQHQTYFFKKKTIQNNNLTDSKMESNSSWFTIWSDYMCCKVYIKHFFKTTLSVCHTLLKNVNANLCAILIFSHWRMTHTSELLRYMYTWMIAGSLYIGIVLWTAWTGGEDLTCKSCNKMHRNICLSDSITIKINSLT